MPIEFESVGPKPAVDVTNEGVRPAAESAKPVSSVPEVDVPGKPAPRSLPESVRERIAALRAGPPPKVANDPKPADGTSSSPVAADEAPANENGEETPTEEKPPEPEVPEWHAEREELRGVSARQREIISRLESDLAAAKKQAAESEAHRSKRLDEAEETYVRNPTGALKSYLASALGVEPDSEDVKRELMDLYIDLTSEITGASLDPAHQAKRVSDLTRREWDRTTKRREAGEKKQAETVAPSEQGSPNETAITIVKTAYQSIADKHPHLTNLAHKLDGIPVEAVLWDVIEKGLRSGDFKADEDDAVLTAKAAKLAENHYKRRWNEIQAAAPKPSTAQPGVPATKQDPPAAAPAKTVERQGNGRGLSNADASVAPSKTPSTTESNAPPKFKTDAERRRWATRHLRGEG